MGTLEEKKKEFQQEIENFLAEKPYSIPCQKCLNLGRNFHRVPYTYCDCAKGQERKQKESKLWFRLTNPIFTFINETIYKLKQLPFEIKCFYQRGRYGMSVRDKWNLQGHLTTTIIDGCLHLLENKHGVGNSFLEKYPKDEDGNTSEEDFQKAIKEQDEVLYDIANCFACAEILEDPYDIINGETVIFPRERLEFYKSEVDRGLDLLKKHYWDLWD